MTSRMYLNFDLLIEAGKEGYRAHVLRSPVGQATSPFIIPFSPTELATIQVVGERTRHSMEAIGRRLFSAVFQGEVDRCLLRSLDKANASNASLRICLHLNSDTPELAELPWELLYDPTRKYFLALSERTPIVRYLDLPETEAALTTTLPLRILIVLANPNDVTPQLNSEAEWEQLQSSFRDLQERNLVIMERLPVATLPALQAQLQKNVYHIFHFIGHGFFDQATNQGNLIMENNSGQAQPVTADALSTLLRDHRSLRLAFLNACEGGRSDKLDLFSGTAQRLVQQGLPAVITMQTYVSDRGATDLAHNFYRALVSGFPVDAALTEARKALFIQDRASEWATPVLFMRAADGKLFEIPALERETPQTPGVSPFKGLVHFDIGDAELFFGREALTAELITILFPGRNENRPSNGRFLAVIGASGSGKSSLVRAGLISALQRGHSIADKVLPPKGSEHWPIIVITPTANPLESLATELTHNNDSVRATASLLDDLTNDPRSLHLYVRKLLTTGRASAAAAQPRRDRLVLVVDQFEELFTLCRNRAERKAFIDNLLYAAGIPLNNAGDEPQQELFGPTVVVITLRADFYASCAEFDNLRGALEQHQKYIGPMTRDELRRAIELPAHRHNWEFEEGLVDLILDDVGSEPGALPLLSHALLETWNRRSGRTLTFEGYTAAGRVQGAIAKTADQVFKEGLTIEQQAIARTIFLRLTELGEGVQDTRRRVALDELLPHTDKRQAVTEVLTALADARLVTTDRGGAEVAHEALIREWPQLREWLNDDREGLRVHRRLTELAHEWQTLHQDPDALLRGSRLEQTLIWAQEHGDQINQLEQEFLNASHLAQERKLAEEEAHRVREEENRRLALEQAKALAYEQQQRAEEQTQAATNLRRRNQWLRVASGAALLLAALAVWFGFQSRENARQAAASAADALQQQHAAVQARETAEAANHVAEIRKNLALSNQDLAERNAKMAETQAEAAYRSRIDALRRARLAQSSQLAAKAQLSLLDPRSIAESQPLLLVREAINTTWLTDTDVITQPFVPAEADLTLRLVINQAPAWQMTLPRRHHSATIWSANYSPDGKTLVTSSTDLTLRLWDVATRQQIRLLQGHTAAPRSAEFSPDGAWLASAGEDGTARIWEVATGKTEHILRGHEGTILTVAFSPDGASVVTAGIDKTARLWDVATGQEIRQFLGHEARLRSAAFSADGQWLVTTNEDKTARLWEVATGQELFVFREHTNQVRSAAFSPDGNMVVTGGDDSQIILWDRGTGQEIRRFTDHEDRIWVVRFSADGKTLLSCGDDGIVRLWDVASGKIIHLLKGHIDTVVSANFSPDGKTVVTSGNDHTARFWDVNTGKEFQQLEGHTAAIHSVAISPDGKTIATGGADQTVRLWSAETGVELRVLLGYTVDYTEPISTVIFSPNGRLLAAAGGDHAIHLWNTSSWQEFPPLQGHEGPVNALAFSPDSQSLISASADGTTRFWQVSNAQELRRLEEYTATVQALALQPNGQALITLGTDQTLQLWDTATGKNLRHFDRVTSQIQTVAFSPNRTLVATGSADGSVQLWDGVSGRVINSFTAHSAAVTAVAFSPDGNALLTASTDRSARLWNPWTGEALGRPLYGHTDTITAAIFSGDGKTIITGSADWTARLWQANPQHDALVFEAHSDTVNWAVFSPDGQRVATASSDGTAKLWDATTGKQIYSFDKYKDEVSGIAFNPDGKEVATADNSGAVQLWDVASGQQVRILTEQADGLNSITFSPDGKRLASASKAGYAYLWDLATGKTITLTGHTGEVRSTNFSPDGATIVTASFDNTIRLWDALNGQQIGLLQGHTDRVNFAAFSPDGQFIVSASHDLSVRIWTVATGEEVHRFVQTDRVRTADFSPDGKTVITASDDNSVWFWDVASQRAFRHLEDHTDNVASALFSPDGKRLVTASEDGSVRIWVARIEDLLDQTNRLIQRDPPILDALIAR